MEVEWFKTWFDTEYYHLLYSNRDENEARQFIDALLRFLKPAKDARFLDAACGKGRHALQLSQKGYNTVGIDLSKNSIECARKWTTDSLTFEIRDLRKPFNCGTFDYALNLFTSFGYFETLDEHHDALSNIYDALNPNGILVLDYFNCDAIEAESSQLQSVVLDGIKFKTEKKRLGNLIQKSISVDDQGQLHEFKEVVMAFSPLEIQEMISEAGFQILSLHGNYHLDEWNPEHPRVIIIAQKQ